MSQTSPPVPLLGRIALHLRLLTHDQLSDATREQARDGSGKSLGTILVEKGFLSEAQLQAVLKARDQLVAKHRARQAVEAADARPEVAAPAPSRRESERRAAREAGPAPRKGPTPAASPDSRKEPGTPTPAAGQAPGARAAAPPAESPDEAGLHEILKQGVARLASDIHIHAGSPLRMRIAGRFQAVDEAPLEPARAEQLVLAALSPEQRQSFWERGELDLSYSAPGVGRFRVNVYRQQRGMDGVFRNLPPRPPTLDDLALPASLARFTNFHQGLVLVTGPANCGKSSTLAALVDIINEERREHILTIEDPIEVLHPSKRCVVNQRNVGPHTESFARALRAALREDPDVIVIGELRDLETVSLALTAAETGHLVLGTLHTNNAIRTVNRLIGVFAADQQDQIRNMVSESLRVVVSQRLVPSADGKRRLPALEVLVVNKAVGNLIRENKTFQIHSILQTGSSQGMCLMDDSLSQLVEQDLVSREEALRHCEDPRRIPG